MPTAPLPLLFACLMLAACGADKRADNAPQASSESLPQPDPASGSVTGMPNPGTPAASPPPVQAMTAASNVDSAPEDSVATDPMLPEDPPTISVDGSGIDKSPADAVPVKPAQPPEAIQPSQPVPPTEP